MNALDPDSAPLFQPCRLLGCGLSVCTHGSHGTLERCRQASAVQPPQPYAPRYRPPANQLAAGLAKIVHRGIIPTLGERVADHRNFFPLFRDNRACRPSYWGAECCAGRQSQASAFTFSLNGGALSKRWRFCLSSPPFCAKNK